MYPLPVHRVSNPKSPIVQQQSSRGEPRPVSNSRPPQTKPGRKCVTPHCNEVLPAESTASRCFPCVKREWRSKFQGKANGGLSRPHKWPKTVTWSDTLEVDSCAVKDAAKEDEPPALRPLKSPPEPPTLPRENPPSSSEALDCKEIPASYTSPLPQPTDDSSIFTSSSPRLGETPPTSTVSTSPIFLHSKIGTTLKSPSPSPHKSEYYTSAALQFPATLSSTTRDTPFQSISGWDSDLTDLGDLTCLENSEMSSSDMESAEELPSFKIRIPARPLSISVPQSGPTICSISRCHRVLPVGYRWKCCVQCRLHHREYQRKRLNIRGKHKRLDEETDRDFITRQDPTAKPPPDFLTPGARLCTIRNCTQIIPSPEEYPWKMCEPCRIRMRDTARRRRMKKLCQPGGQSTVEGVASTSQADVESGSESEDIPSAVLPTAREPSERSLRRCKRRDCGLWINPQSQDILCNQCKKRQLSSSETVIKRVPLPKKTIPLYTEYVCWTSLLDAFHKRITGFLEAHRCYKRFKQTSRPAQVVRQAIFKFEGEFSVVALDFEVLGRKPEVHHHTMRLKDEIGCVGDLLFLPTYCVTILEQEEGIATRFKCQSRSLRKAEVHGELEIAVLPDHSHILLPGQRIIVRFCLVV